MIKAIFGSTQVYLWLGVFSLFIGYTAWVDRKATERCNGRVATAVAEERKRQQTVVSTALENANKAAQQQNVAQQALELKIQELVSNAQRQPVSKNGSCVDRDTARRLRGLQR